MTIPKYAYVKWLKRRRWHWRQQGVREEAWLKGRTKPKRLKHIDNKLTVGQECRRSAAGWVHGVEEAFSIKYDGKRWAQL